MQTSDSKATILITRLNDIVSSMYNCSKSLNNIKDIILAPEPDASSEGVQTTGNNITDLTAHIANGMTMLEKNIADLENRI